MCIAVCLCTYVIVHMYINTQINTYGCTVIDDQTAKYLEVLDTLFKIPFIDFI